MIQTFSDGAIEWFIDRDRRVLFGHWSGDFGGEDLLEASPVLWQQYPELAEYGAIHDLLDFTGIVEHRYARELTRRLAELFGEPNPHRRTAIVAVDPMKVFELKATKADAPESRQLRLFGNNTVALEWVTADEPDNPSACSRPNAERLPWWFERKGAVAKLSVR